MIPALIDHTNFDTHLKQSTQGRAGTPDGNIYFDTANDRVEIITAEELSQINFGSGLEDNPLTNDLGITGRGLYNFENQERGIDETLRNFLRSSKGIYRFTGAYAFWDGNKLAADGTSTSDGDDRNKIRGSGIVEFSDDGKTVDRIYHGVRSLVDIQATTQGYFAFVTDTLEATLQSATWENFYRQGDVDEMVQVFGTTANGDAGAGDFDYTTRIMVVRPRSWQYTPQETTSVSAGITEFAGFSGGYGAGESINNENTYNKADVFGGSAIAPFDGMSLTYSAGGTVKSGFNEADGTFKWILNNANNGTVQECTAYLDACSLEDADIDAGAGTYNGKAGRIWYRREAGKVITNSIDGAGLFIDGLSAVEKQKLKMTDDSENEKTYPFFPTVEISVGAIAPTDPKAFYHVLYLNGAGVQDFDKAGAVTVNNASGDPVKGIVQSDHTGNKISFPYDFDGNTQAGLASGINKMMVVIVEGDGIASQAITVFEMSRSTLIAVTCSPGVENNA